MRVAAGNFPLARVSRAQRMEQQLVTDSWLLVSAEGFRMQQAGREPALLVKELLQNSLDAAPATIDFKIEYNNSEQNVRVVCDDVGEGVEILIKCAAFFGLVKRTPI
jgi:hypothetical protein